MLDKETNRSSLFTSLILYVSQVAASLTVAQVSPPRVTLLAAELQVLWS
jgi:hypothetical protein